MIKPACNLMSGLKHKAPACTGAACCQGSTCAPVPGMGCLPSRGDTKCADYKTFPIPSFGNCQCTSGYCHADGICASQAEATAHSALSATGNAIQSGAHTALSTASRAFSDVTSGRGADANTGFHLELPKLPSLGSLFGGKYEVRAHEALREDHTLVLSLYAFVTFVLFTGLLTLSARLLLHRTRRIVAVLHPTFSLLPEGQEDEAADAETEQGLTE